MFWLIGYVAIAAVFAWLMYDDDYDLPSFGEGVAGLIVGMFWPILLLMAALDGFN